MSDFRKSWSDKGFSVGQRYYAVRKGRQIGVFTAWDGPGGARDQVKEFKGAVYKGFASQAEAEAFVRNKPEESRRARPQANLDAISVYTDGGAIGNPGPGAYGTVILKPGEPPCELSRGFRLTTNNRMELMGCIAALEFLRDDSALCIYSDSKYLVDAVNKRWARTWRQRGWRKSDGQPALNVDLWERLLALLDRRDITLVWIKGHAGYVWNERCDQLVHETLAQGIFDVDCAYEERQD